MARYSPTAELKIKKACAERWEDMRGDSRVRHCAACGRDVINAASLTPEQVEQHIAAAFDGAPMPCMRLVQFEDGSLLTARSEGRLSLRQRAGAALSALTIAATTAIAQQLSRTGDGTLTGRIIDATGEGISGASVTLQQPNHTDLVVKTAADGTFKIEAAPGEYGLSADSRGFERLPVRRVILHNGTQDLPQPLKLNVAASMGQVIVVSEDVEVKTENPKWAPVLH